MPSTKANGERTSHCVGRAALSPTSISICPRHNRQSCARTKRQSRWFGALPLTTPIAGILNRQDRKSAYGHRFTANLVGNLRRHWNIACFERPTNSPEGELLTIKQTATALGVATSTIHRWLNNGLIAGEQLTPGAPWRIRLTGDLRERIVEEAPADYLTVYQTMRLLGVSRQTVWQRLKLIRPQPDLFEQPS